MTKILGRSDFLAATQNRKRELVEVPELNGSVYIGALYGGQIVAYNERIAELTQKGEKSVNVSTSLELMALLVSMSACDENGEALFTEADVKELAKQHPGVLMALSVKAMEITGLSNAAVEEVKENLKKAVSVDSATN